MLVSGEKAYNSVWRKENTTLVANGHIQLYYNPQYEVILIVEKSKMLKLEMNGGFTIFGEMVQHLMSTNWVDCFEFYHEFFHSKPNYRDYVISLREMYVGSKKFAMNA